MTSKNAIDITSFTSRNNPANYILCNYIIIYNKLISQLPVLQKENSGLGRKVGQKWKNKKPLDLPALWPRVTLLVHRDAFSFDLTDPVDCEPLCGGNVSSSPWFPCHLSLTSILFLSLQSHSSLCRFVFYYVPPTSCSNWSFLGPFSFLMLFHSS